MKPFGGEIHFKDDEDLFSYFTDSGRSSLRLIFQSGLGNMKFLVPDYLCSVILHTFKEEKVKYDFYKVNIDLSINKESIKNKQYDVLYLIDYFGKKHNDISELINSDTILLEDCVFLPYFYKPDKFYRWIGYNSFRKISPLADGSIIKSTIQLNEMNIVKADPLFSKIKYQAKEIKYDFYHFGKHSEREYLDLFQKGEEKLDAQSEIFNISNKSIFLLMDFYKNLYLEYAIRKNNYTVLHRYLREYGIPIEAEYHSHYVLAVDKRDELKEYLFSHNIFLPVHWPRIEGIDNILFSKIISIPVDSRYSKNEMITIAKLINGFYNK